jgi:hypothetical protein
MQRRLAADHRADEPEVIRHCDDNGGTLTPDRFTASDNGPDVCEVFGWPCCRTDVGDRLSIEHGSHVVIGVTEEVARCGPHRLDR